MANRDDAPGGTTRRMFLEVSTSALAGLAAASRAAAATWQPPKPRGVPDLPAPTIAGAAALLAARKLSPVELVDAVLARIDAFDSRIGAFITVAAEAARAAAQTAEREIQRGGYRGLLHGIPFGVKDTYYTKGLRTTAGSPVLRDFVPDHDAAIVERLKAAGAVLIGKLNLPEFSFGGTTPGCHNPWDLTRNPGGSSGGSAAALAAALVLAAPGGDTSGSIRNPASACGVVGLKPTFGLVSRHGVVPISWTLDHLGPMARTVEDVALLLDVMAGYDTRDRASVRTSAGGYQRQLRRSMRGVRIGVMAAGDIANFHPDVRRAFAGAVDVFAGLGAELREVRFPERMTTAGECQRIIRICEAAAYHRQFLTTEAAGRYLPDSVSGPGVSVRTSVEAGSLLTAAHYVQAQRARAVFVDDMRAAYAGLDAFLSPTMPAPAGVPVNPPETFRAWWNVSGFPALSLPCGFSTSPAGLPIGLQVSGLPFTDGTVLAVAHAYESATEWHTRRPPGFGGAGA